MGSTFSDMYQICYDYGVEALKEMVALLRTKNEPKMLRQGGQTLLR